MKISGPLAGAFGIDSAFAAIDEILAGIAHQRMFGVTKTAPAVAAVNSVVQVSNPSGSGKNLYFFMGDAWVPTAMTLSVSLNGTDQLPAATPVNAFAGGAASVAKYGGGSTTGVTGTVILLSPSLTANTVYLFPNWWWLGIPPNNFVQFTGGTVNQALTVNLRWVELSA